ncbi:septum formation initiator family protein [Jeotgalibaca porci]|uniref:Septum formation initiator family protein n=1 Tax=Jeotgalibaca porci TaxID=1868793 RepID=A0A6G7WIE9_9LACT|nr:septum formation initiator family protein [Jeotgalibaca porci]NLB99556.1 septum formation initiator family protein [Lactobacillales bacterium]QIK52044.1 septum formation initiator family protein [Jeotgalibaca porci]
MLRNRRKNDPKQQNITQINNNYTHEKTLEKQQLTLLNRNARRRKTALAIIAAGILLPLGYNVVSNVHQINQVDVQIAEAKAEKKELEKENQRLNVQVGLLQDDEYVAKLARSRYYFSKDKEIIFSLPEDNQSKAASQIEGEN